MLVPVAILLGELLYGTLSSMQNVSWNELWQPFSIVVIGGIVALRMGRRQWLTPWKGPLPPDAETSARMIESAYKYLRMAWGFAALQALAGMAMMLFASPRENAYVFTGISVVYFLLYFPRKSFFQHLALTSLHR